MTQRWSALLLDSDITDTQGTDDQNWGDPGVSPQCLCGTLDQNGIRADFQAMAGCVQTCVDLFG